MVSQGNPIFNVEQFPESHPALIGRVEYVARGGTPVVMDYDQDGWMDIYLMRYGFSDILFRNDQSGGFERVENPFGLDPDNGGNVPVWADLDNDGDKDLFVATVNEDHYLLYINRGNGYFVEEAQMRGASLPAIDGHKGAGAAVGDINRDGYLDLFVGDWGTSGHEDKRRQHFALFLNAGAKNPGYFYNITSRAGVELPVGNIDVYSPNFTDLDSDGWPDLAVVSDYGKSKLFWNNADNTFTDGTLSSQIGKETNGMGSAIGDVNNDGRLDWWVTSIGWHDQEIGNTLYINNGDRLFQNISKDVGVNVGGWAWGSNFFDYDNDGDQDIALTNDEAFFPFEGIGWEQRPSPMILWMNSGDATFTDVSSEEGFLEASNGAGMVNLDYDKDGDLDLFVVNQWNNPMLLRNDLESENHWLRITLEGTLSNRDGIGAFITIEAEEGGDTQVSEFNPTNTYLAQLEPAVHFGLGPELESVFRVTVLWPSGAVQELKNVLVNQVLHIVEDESLIGIEEIPVFSQEPQRQILHLGDPLTLTVEIEGDSEASIQWFHNGELLFGETGTTLHIEEVGIADAGKYYATATNNRGITYSAHARVSVRKLHLDKSVARQWMEESLDAIRLDYPAPTVHSRNLFSVSTAMWDAWSAFDATSTSVAYLADENPDIPDDPAAVEAMRSEAISYAAYRVLRSRFRLSPNAEISLPALRERMEILGFDPDNVVIDGDSPAAIGNRIAAKVLAFGWSDGANEKDVYEDQTGYEPINRPMVFSLPGTELFDPNLWQPLAFDHLVLQNGIVIGRAIQEFLGSNWGGVTPFALIRESDEDVYQDPGPPPYLRSETDQVFKDAALEVIEFSSWLDPSDPTLIDVSPNSRHNNTLGFNDGTGYLENPYTGEPYDENLVLRADYGRILAEFWADGPDSETPPGHWNSVANYVSDHELFEKLFEGEGPVLDDLEWDVKLYFAMNAAVSDGAIACWDAKRKYNYVRPISMIRYMGGLGQSSDENGPSYHPEGLPLKPGLVEVITRDSVADGERHAHLEEYVGEIAIFAWKGIPENPSSEYGGVGWIRAVEWMPYQRYTFVTPPFGAYTSGHSTFSRAGAEVLTAITGDEFFPGGISSFSAPAHEFLEFENGPEEEITLTWATYFDAADEAGVSRLYGGIHVWADDLKGRIMGSEIGQAAYAKARTYFDGTATTKEWDPIYEDWVSVMVKDLGQVGDPEFYETGQLNHLARYFMGSEPLSSITSGTMVRLLTDPVDETLGVQIFLNHCLVNFDSELQVSSNMVDWVSLPSDAVRVSDQLEGNGLRRIIMFDEHSELLGEARFMRVLVKEAY